MKPRMAAHKLVGWCLCVLAGGGLYLGTDGKGASFVEVGPNQQPEKQPSDTEEGSAGAKDDAMFARLTANAWAGPCDRSAHLNETCQTVELRGDGSYLWSTRSDVGERRDNGRWNFSSRGDGEGVLFLSNSGVVSFGLIGHDLEFPPIGRLHPEEKLTPKGSRDGLPEVTPPLLFGKLTSGTWFKANDFGSDDVPGSIDFRSNGTMAVVYRSGQCRGSGTWSLYQSGSWNLLGKVKLEACDGKNSDSRVMWMRSRVDLTDETLVINEPYRQVVPEAQLVIVGDGRLVGRGTLSGRLIEGEAVDLDLLFENLLSSSVTVKSAAISLQPLEVKDGNLSYSGPPETLAEIDLGDRALAPGGTFRVATQFTPRRAVKRAALQFRVDGEVPLRRDLLTTIHPRESSAPTR